MGGRGSFTDEEMLPRRGSPVEGSMRGREHCFFFFFKEHGSKLNLRRKIEGRESSVEEEALRKVRGGSITYDVNNRKRISAEDKDGTRRKPCRRGGWEK